MSHLNYLRHLSLLAFAAALLLIFSRFRQSIGLLASFAVYGAVHCSAFTATLRTPAPLWRKLTFIALGAGLSALTVKAGFYLAAHVGMFIGVANVFVLLVILGLLGAAMYAILIRLFWIARLSWWGVALISVSCAAAMLLPSIFGIANGAGASVWVAIVWWFAFSMSLWYFDLRLERTQ